MVELSKEIITDSDASGTESSGSSVTSLPPKSSKKNTEKSESKSKKSSSSKKKARSPSPSSSSESGSESEDVAMSGQEDTLKRPSATIQRTGPSIRAKPYAPPDGFQSMKKYPTDSSDISKSFSNLNGKQIWHLTAPVGVPISSIKELALDAVATGQSVLSRKGADYRLREDRLGAEKTKMLLIPDKQGQTYTRTSLPVVQTFHIEQIVSVPNNATLSTAETEKVIQKLKKPLPTKPKHLRMRYHPFGSADGEPETIGYSSEDSEMEDMSFREPSASTDRDAKKRKRKSDIDGSKACRESDVAGTKGEVPRKKVKKDNDDDEDRGRAENITGSKNSKKRKDETSQERKARKEEQKRKKREKGE